MGQQQLLLIVLGVIIVGIAITLGIALFRENAIVNKRDILIHECTNIATGAMEYYKKPQSMGGGGRSFTGWSIPSDLSVSGNGRFEAQISSSNIVITGTGNEVVTGTDSIKVQVTVYPDTISTTIIQ